MYLIPIAWLYVVILVAAAEDTIVAAVLTFVFWGLAPLALFLWLFGVVGLARDTLHREAPELARDVDHVVIDGPPRVAGLMRSALLAADLVMIPVQPSPLDGWASAEMLSLLGEARIYRPQLAARFVLNRCAARTVLARETAETLADHDPPLLSTTIGQRIVFADVVQTGRLAAEQDEDCPGAREIAALAAEVARIGA